MKNVLTFLLPGVGQLFSGDAKKAGTIFLTAIVLSMLTAGLGWFAAGAWSVMDLQTRRSNPDGNPAPAGAAGSAGGSTTEAKRGRPAGAIESAMPWVFKFSILAVCTYLVLHNIRSGGVLQSLNFFGVRMQFASSLAEQAGGGGESSEGTDESASGTSALEEASNAFAPEIAKSLTTALEGLGTPAETEIHDDAGGMGGSAGASNASFAGEWGSDIGATYSIRRDGDYVEIVETSRFLFVPMTTMTCYGQAAGAEVRAECTTYTQETGQLILTPNSEGGLAGVFTAYSNGVQIPLNLRR